MKIVNVPTALTSEKPSGMYTNLIMQAKGIISLQVSRLRCARRELLTAGYDKPIFVASIRSAHFLKQQRRKLLARFIHAASVCRRIRRKLGLRVNRIEWCKKDL